MNSLLLQSAPFQELDGVIVSGADLSNLTCFCVICFRTRFCLRLPFLTGTFFYFSFSVKELGFLHQSAVVFPPPFAPIPTPGDFASWALNSESFPVLLLALLFLLFLLETFSPLFLSGFPRPQVFFFLWCSSRVISYPRTPTVPCPVFDSFFRTLRFTTTPATIHRLRRRIGFAPQSHLVSIVGLFSRPLFFPCAAPTFVLPGTVALRCFVLLQTFFFFSFSFL